MRVVIDARLEPGLSGGVQGVIAGIAKGLSGLIDSADTYSFVVREEAAGWIEPFVSGPAEEVVQSRGQGNEVQPVRGPRRAIADALPPVRSAWRFLRRPDRTSGPPRDRFIDELAPDLVHFPLQTGRIVDVPSIYHPHDLQHIHMPENFTRQELEWRNIWYPALARRASMVAVASSWTKRDVEAHLNVRPDRVRVIPLAPPLLANADEASAPRDVLQRFGLPPRFILFPAQTWPHKNHRRLLESIALLRNEGLVVPLVATGATTDHFPALQAIASNLGIEPHVRWTGYVSMADLRAIYGLAVAVIIPSRFEAASAPLWEAFAEGVPAACSNITSLPEQAGDAALLFDPDDVPAIADAIRTLWTEEAVRSRLIQAGRARVVEFTWDRTARTFRAHYRRLTRRAMTAEDEVLVQAKAAL